MILPDRFCFCVSYIDHNRALSVVFLIAALPAFQKAAGVHKTAAGICFSVAPCAEAGALSGKFCGGNTFVANRSHANAAGNRIKRFVTQCL